jgi:hypothetical protein
MSSDKPACFSSKVIPPANVALRIYDGCVVEQQQLQHQNRDTLITQLETLHILEETVHTPCLDISNSVAAQSLHDDPHTDKHIKNDSSEQQPSL